MIKTRVQKFTAWLLTFAMLMTLMPTFALGAGASVTAIEDVPVISAADAAEVKASIPVAPASGVPGASAAESDASAVLLSGESTSTDYPLWVGGEQITSEKLTVTGATGTATYAPDTNTLTLNNYTYSGAGYTDAAILYNKGSGTLNLVLEGNNAVTQTGGELSQAIFVDGNIDISGSGSLIANAGTASASYGFSCGIYALGDISVSGNVTLSATSGADSGIGYVNCGIFALDLTVSGGTVTAIGGTASGSMAISCGIQVNQSMTVTGGTLKAIGGTASGQNGASYGIYASASSVTLSGGETVAQGNTAAFNNAPTIGSTFTNAGLWYGESESSAVAGAITDLASSYSQKYVRIAENTPAPVTEYPLWVGGEQITSEKLTVTGATGTATYAPDTNTLTLNNYTYTGAGNDFSAINYEDADPLNLVLVGENSLTHTGGQASFCLFSDGGLHISGTGTLRVTAGATPVEFSTAESFGIRSNKNITVSSGTLIVSGGSVSGGSNYGIYSDSNITVSGGTVTATGGTAAGESWGGSYGVYACGDITVSGGALTASGGTFSGFYGSSCGVYASTLTVSGGSLTAIGGTASRNSSGIDAYLGATLSGGTTKAMGEDEAFRYAPTIGSTFTNAGLWYGEDEASAVSGPITDLANRYNEKFVKVAENDTPPVFSVGISAVDTANGEEIAGAHLQVLDSAGFVVDEWVSVQDDTETTAVDESIYTTAPLNIGTTYTLHAVVAPVGYTLSSDTTFSIGMNGIPVTAGSMTLDGVLLIGFDRTEVKILAVDAVDESTAIRGATLQILDEHDTVVEEWVSYEDPHTIYALEIGIPHILRAAAAPDGYDLPSEQQFAIDEGGRITFSGSKTQDGTLLLGFMPIQRYSVTSAAEPAAGGSITLSVDKAARDEAFDVTVTVNDGYAVAGLYYVDGLGSETPFSAGGNSIQSPGTHTLAMPLDSPVQILVRFAPKVTFVDWDGAPLHEQYVLYGSAATAPDPAPSLEGHTFIGWDPAFDNVTAPLTVTALYRANQYTFTFDSDGGSAVDPITQDYGTEISAPAAPSKPGYIFAGWDKDLPETMPAEDLTFTAQWTRVAYSGGSSVPTTSTTVSKNEDGSTTTVTEDKATGAKTEVTTRPDGSSVTVETKPDGTVTTTEKAADGSSETTVKKPDGTSTVTGKSTDGTTTVTTAQPDGSTTTEEVRKDGTSVKTSTPAGGETTAEVKSFGKTEVTVPVPEADAVTAVIVTDKNGNKTELKDFEVTANGVKFPVSGDCTVSFARAAKKTFEDVHPVNHWALADVDYTYIKGLMKGTSETRFSPDAPLTRAMLVTILYRHAGEPATNRSIPFADVDMGAYYGNAVSWAKQNGIVTGISETHFAPDANITREQFAAIIFRYAMAKGMNAVTMEENLHFKDAGEISAYAVSAMNWAVGAGLIKGRSASTVAPRDNATRAEAAAILHRFLESGKA